MISENARAAQKAAELERSLADERAMKGWKGREGRARAGSGAEGNGRDGRARSGAEWSGAEILLTFFISQLSTKLKTRRSRRWKQRRSLLRSALNHQLTPFTPIATQFRFLLFSQLLPYLK